MTGPTRPPPPGMQWIWEPGFGFVLAPAAQTQEPPRGPMYRGGQRPYYPQGDSREHAPPQQPQQPKSLADSWQESLGFLRTATRVVREMNSLVPGYGEQSAPEPVVAEDDDSPIKIVDTGHGKLALNKEDGALRWAETGMMALPGIMKWLGETADKIQKNAADRQQPAPPRRLKPGYVEVHPGYKPPPGYVAVPVDQQEPEQEEELPPPPEDVPPPISPWETSAIPREGDR